MTTSGDVLILIMAGFFLVVAVGIAVEVLILFFSMVMAALIAVGYYGWSAIRFLHRNAARLIGAPPSGKGGQP